MYIYKHNYDDLCRILNKTCDMIDQFVIIESIL